MEDAKQNAKLEISKGAQIAAKWWTDRLDGTVLCSATIIECAENLKKKAEESGDELRKMVASIIYDNAVKAEDSENYISKEVSDNLRRNIEILLQKGINERGYEWLATDEDRAWGVLALACYMAGVDHENIKSLPLDVMMHVSADKVEMDFANMEKHQIIYDAKQEAILHGAKQSKERNC